MIGVKNPRTQLPFRLDRGSVAQRAARCSVAAHAVATATLVLEGVVHIVYHVGETGVIVLVNHWSVVTVTGIFIHVHGLTELSVLVCEGARVRGRYLHGNVIAN